MNFIELNLVIFINIENNPDYILDKVYDLRSLKIY